MKLSGASGEGRTPAYLVFDIETVVDGRLVQLSRYPQEPGLEPGEAVRRYQAELLERSQGQRDFIPHTYHLPVSVAIAKVDADFRLIDASTLDRPRFRPHAIARDFWNGWAAYKRKNSNLCLVTFNGRGFDLPVLEMAAFRFGLSVPEWFHQQGPQYGQPRYRYNHRDHFDVMDFLSNYGMPLAGGLDLCATLLGKPGKMEISGKSVRELWESGQGLRIDDYCLCDVLDTYFCFLRTRVLQAQLTLEAERERVEEARAWIDGACGKNEGLGEYLRRFRYWEPPRDELQYETLRT